MKKLFNWIGEAVDKLLLGYMSKIGLVLWDMGGSNPPASTTQTTSNIPDWAVPYANRNLGRAEALTDINQNPYQTYQGNRVADFNPLQQQAFTNVAGMQTNTGTGNAMNQTQDAYNRSANAGPYNAQNFGNQYGSGPQFQNMGLGYLSANAQNFGQQSAQDYMSPYQQNVTDFQKQQAISDYGRNLPGMNAQASSAGAFGGTRQALVAAEGQRNLQNQLSGIQAIGSQNAYQNAQQQFNADQARQMQAQLANQGTYGQMQGLGMQQNLSANQQAMQNAAQRAQYGLAGQQAGEASRQFGANYGLQNRQQALAAAGQLGTLGQQQYAQQQGINAAQQQAGAQMQAQEQQGLSNRYQDFLNQQNYPYKQLGFMSDIVRGTPTSGGAQSMYQAPPSGISQFAGLAGGLGSLYGGYNQANRGAAGGDVRGYAVGGKIVPLPSAAERKTVENINAGESTVGQALEMGADLQRLLVASAQLKEQMQENTIRGLQNQLALATGMPEQQNTTVEEDVSNMLRRETESRQGGIADLDTGNLGENYNSGGIVAFTDNKDQPVQADMPTSPAGRWARSMLQRMRKEGVEAAEKQAAENKIRIQHGMAAGPLGVFMNQSDEQRAAAQAAIAGVNNPAAAPAAASTAASTAFVGPPAPAGGAPAGAPAGASAAAPANIQRPPLIPPPAAPGSGEPVSTPAMDAARKSIVDMQRRSLQGLSDLDNPEVDPATGEPVPKKTLASIAAEQDTERKRAFKASGVPEQGYKERITELTGQASQARQDRDVDRWMAAAQGFFAMAGGKSQYAMQNMAEGLGVGTKQLQAAEKEYRVGEKARLESIGVLKQAQRAEELGHQKEAANSFEEYQKLQQKEKESKRRTLENLGVVAAQKESTLAVSEMQAQQLRDAAAARVQAAGIAARQSRERAAEFEAGRTDRAKEIANQKYADMQVRLERQHPLILKGELPSKLTALGDARLQLATNPKNPRFIENVNNLTAEVDRMQDQVANDTAKKAKQFIKAGNSEWGTLHTSGGTK